MRTFGLIGYPLSHSFSQQYFTKKFERERIADCTYKLFPISSIEALPALLAGEPQLCGLNVTIPYKKEVLRYLHDTTHLPLQACNCIKVKQGKLSGFNTDILGFEQSLLQHWQPHHHSALVLGTGGAAEAVLYVLRKLQVQATQVSRKKSPRQRSYADLTPEVVQAHPLIINCTPLGTYPATDACPPLPYEAVGPQHYLYDLVYNPPLTRFLQKGLAQRATIKNGYDMLVLQAEASWQIWNDEGL
jgi:shikimate dehydrogenase